MDKKHVNIIAWILSFIIFVPLTFMCGMWVFIPIGELNIHNFDVLVRVLGIVAVFLVIVLFLPISKKYIKIILAIILFVFLLSGVFVYSYYCLMEGMGNPFQ